jgi:hypothetical protein
MTASSPWRAQWRSPTLAAAAGFLLLTAWFTYPQIVALDRVVPHQDPMFSTWRLAWIGHQLPRAPLNLLDANILHPARRTAAFSDAAPLLGVMAAPMIWLGVPAVVAYNVMLLASFVAAALGAFLLVRELTGSNAAGFVAGIVFGFSPFRFEHYMHLEIVWSCWIPLTLWALHRTIATGRWTFGLLTGLALAAQVFSCVYLAMFLATWLVLIGVLLLLFGVLDPRTQVFRALVTGAILCGAIVAPYARAYMDSSRVVGMRSAEETRDYSAQPHNYLSSPAGNRLYGWTRPRWGVNEKQLFPGVTAVLLALIGVWPLSKTRIVYAIATLFALDLSMGFNGLTYAALWNAIPIFHGLRVPARAATLVQLGLAILGGYAIARFMERPRSQDGANGARARRGVMVTILAGALAIAEYTNRPLHLVPLPTRPAVLQKWLAEQQDVVLVELPVPRADRLPGEDPRYQFLSTFHWQRMVNGYSALAPPRYLRLMDAMMKFPDDRSIGAIRARGVTHLVIHPELYADEDGHALIKQLAVSPDFTFVGWFPDGIGTAAVFRLLDRGA